jgi:hypothetical protein
LNHPSDFEENLLILSILIVNISYTDMSKIRWTVVTIHGEFLLFPIFQRYPQDPFTLPP